MSTAALSLWAILLVLPVPVSSSPCCVMKHRGAHMGLATLCIGGGHGCATIVEM